jgi:phenylacetic acid degradation protein PaaD
MNVALSPDEIARACADAMWKEDDASKGLGMKIVEVKPGQAALTMTVQPHMVNGQRIAHGGFIFLLADSTFAFACNSRNERAVAAQCDIAFIRPGQARRCAGGDGARNIAQRPVRDLRRPRHRRRCRDRRIPRSLPHDCRHLAAGCGCRE